MRNLGIAGPCDENSHERWFPAETTFTEMIVLLFNR
jgi:hypothetical protein